MNPDVAPSNGPPKRVLIVMPLAEQRGGGELMFLHLIEHGRELGIDWTVAFLADGPMVAQTRGWGVEAVVIPAGRLRQPLQFARTVRSLRRLVEAKQIDLVFSWMGKAQLYGGLAAWRSRVPAMWYQLGMPDRPGWQDRVATMLPNRGALTCSTSATRAQAAVRPHRPTTTVYPGVDLSRFDSQSLPSAPECRRSLGLDFDGPIVGIVGRLQRWKGMHALVEAMPTILERRPDAQCVIVGGAHAFEPEYPAYLRATIQRLGLSDRVRLVGLQSDVPRWMQAMDVVVHASDAEPFGIVIIEAMALGKPVVATGVAGPSEIITDRVDGRLWEPDHVNQLADAVIDALGPAGRDMAANAPRRAAAFDVHRYAVEVVSAIQAALGGVEFMTQDIKSTPARAEHVNINLGTNDR